MSAPSTEPSYLGDGLYVTWDGYQFWLIANNPRSDQRVALEFSVFKNFLEYAGQRLGVEFVLTPNGKGPS